MTRVLLALALVAGLAGCRIPVRIESEPPGATVFVDGKYLGETPVVCRVMGTMYVRSYDLLLEKEGYRPHESVLERESALIMGSHWPERVVIRLEREREERADMVGGPAADHVK